MRFSSLAMHISPRSSSCLEVEHSFQSSAPIAEIFNLFDQLEIESFSFQIGADNFKFNFVSQSEFLFGFFTD